MRRHHSCGQSLPEYAMLAGLLILGSLMVLQFFSGSVSEKSSQMWSSFNPQGQLATAAGPGVTVTAGGATANSGDSPVIHTGSTSTGEAGAEGSIDTSGNASIRDMVTDALDWENTLKQKSVGDYMDSLPAGIIAKAQEMEAQGIISSGEATEIKNLANQGYRIARAMRVIENSLEANQHLPEASKRDLIVEFEGQTMLVKELSRELGFGNVTIKPGNYLRDLIPNQPTGSASLARDFAQQYKKVQATGAMESPEIAKILDELSYRILFSAESAEFHLSQWAYNNSATDTYNVKDWIIRDMRENTASSSEVICSVGYGEAAGYNCN